MRLDRRGVAITALVALATVIGRDVTKTYQTVNTAVDATVAPGTGAGPRSAIRQRPRIGNGRSQSGQQDRQQQQ